MQETQVQFLGREDPLEQAMTTHSSIPAYETAGRRHLQGYSSGSDMTEQLNSNNHTHRRPQKATTIQLQKDR